MIIDISTKIGTTSNQGGFKGLLDVYSGAAAAYSLRKLSKATTSVVRVRRDADNAERDFTAKEIEDGTLENWVNGIVEDLPLDTESSAAAAYSLRNLSSTYSGAVVRVRRSSDNAEADFTATEVSNGTLEAWVNTDVIQYESDFTSTEDFNETNGIGAAAQSIAGVNGAYKFTLSGGSALHTTRKVILEENKTYNIQFDYYIPSSNSIVAGISAHYGTIYGLNAFTELDGWYSASVSFTPSGTANNELRFTANNGTPIGWINLNADGDVFYLKNIRVTQTTADGLVTTWYDQSSNNNHATQGSASSQPKIVDAGTLVTENGKAAVDFLSDKFLSRAASFGISQPISVTAIHAPRTGETDYYIIDNDSRLIIGEGASGGFGIFADNWVRAASLSTNTQYLSFALFDDSSSYCYVNSSLYASGTAGNNVISTNFTIGANENQSGFNGLNGTIQEIIVFASDQSTNRVNIEGNINTYYNIYTPIVSDGLVTTWYDQSGNGNDATQGSASAQPKIVSAGVLVTENGKVAVSFDGSDDGLATSAFAFSASSVSVFVTYKNGSTSGQKNIFRHRPNGALPSLDGYIWEMGFSTSTTQYGVNTALDDGSGVIRAASSGQGTQDVNQHIEALIYKSDEILAYQDGSLNQTLNTTVGTTPIGAISMTQSLWIGKNFQSNDREYDGLMQELIIYPSDQSGNRNAIEGNINGHYNIYP